MYRTKLCRQCQMTFETLTPAVHSICEDCEQENLNDLYQAQEIDWAQERDHA